jgi:hypothetical protein
VSTPLPYVLVAGYAQLPQTTGAGVLYRHLTIIARVDRGTHRVEAVDTSLATDLAETFVREHLVGRSLSEDVDDFVALVEATYFGHGRKAIIGAVHNMRRRFLDSLELGEDATTP